MGDDRNRTEEPCLRITGNLFFFYDMNALNGIALTDLIQHIQTLVYPSKYCMVPVEMLCVCTAMAYEKLRTAGISSRMCHAQYAPVMHLILAVQLTIDRVSGPPRAVTLRTAALYHKIGDYPMPGKAIIKPLF